MKHFRKLLALMCQLTLLQTVTAIWVLKTNFEVFQHFGSIAILFAFLMCVCGFAQKKGKSPELFCFLFYLKKSIFGKSMWLKLLGRAIFTTITVFFFSSKPILCNIYLLAAVTNIKCQKLSHCDTCSIPHTTHHIAIHVYTYTCFSLFDEGTVPLMLK